MNLELKKLFLLKIEKSQPKLVKGEKIFLTLRKNLNYYCEILLLLYFLFLNGIKTAVRWWTVPHRFLNKMMERWMIVDQCR